MVFISMPTCGMPGVVSFVLNGDSEDEDKAHGVKQRLGATVGDVVLVALHPRIKVGAKVSWVQEVDNSVP